MSFRIYKSERTSLLRIRGCGPALLAGPRLVPFQLNSPSACMDALPPYERPPRTGSQKTSRVSLTEIAPNSWNGTGGLTTKATMSFRMNRMAFDTARYCGLGRSQRGQCAVRGSGAKPDSDEPCQPQSRESARLDMDGAAAGVEAECFSARTESTLQAGA